MPRSKYRSAKGRSWPLVIAALVVFGAFGSLQMILAALNVHLVSVAPVAPASSHGVALVQASGNPAPVTLPVTARPVDANQAAASMPTMSSSKEITLVADEDARIRTLVHDSAHVHQPSAIRYQGALPTLVLPGRTAGYTATDLVQADALVMLSSNVALLRENVFVAAGAQLSLGAPALSTLYLASDSGGFASIVGWGGNLSFTGTAAQPLTIMSWSQVTKSAVADTGNGRAYIREIGATMTIAYARVSSLGFWSGRTGGVAWTGTSRTSSKGSAADSTFTDDTYGAFVSRGQGVTFAGDLFESNELDGLHIHRYSAGSQVTSSAAVRNGGNGFLVDRATTDTLLRGDVSQHNAANGYLIDGRPLVIGASASGGSNLPSSGTVLEGSSATGNAHTSLLIEGGSGTVIKSDQFCSPTTAIALRTDAANSVVTGNYIDCDPRSGISVGPLAPGTVLFGNLVSHPGIGLLIRGSGSVSMYDNRITGATVFGMSARGATSRINGVGNVMSGTGDRALDTRTGASVSGLSGTNTSGWAHHASVTFISYLEFHPLASLWLGILVVILFAAGWSHRRKQPDHPYPASVRRMYPLPGPGGSSVVMEPYPARLQPAVGRHTAPQPTGHFTGPQPTAGRHTAPQPTAGRPAARPARLLAAWDGADLPQSAPREQPTSQPGTSRHRPAYQEPAYGGPAYGQPRPESARMDWNDPVRNGVHWQEPVAPAPAPAAWPGTPVYPYPPSGRERPADPSWEDARDTTPIRKGVWD